MRGRADTLSPTRRRLNGVVYGQKYRQALPLGSGRNQVVHRKVKMNEATNGILTLGQFLELVKDLPLTTQMVVAKDDWFENINEIALPDNDSYFAITFYSVDTFDARQF
jgi:hypothetical protein